MKKHNAKSFHLSFVYKRWLQQTQQTQFDKVATNWEENLKYKEKTTTDCGIPFTFTFNKELPNFKEIIDNTGYAENRWRRQKPLQKKHFVAFQKNKDFRNIIKQKTTLASKS